MLKFSANVKEILRPIYNFSGLRKVKLYLVGGALRDLILNRKKDNPDFDFCLKRSALSFGRKLAVHLKAAFVLLDEEHGACRLVKRIEGKIYTFDFTDFRGPNLEKDLLRRDFTINSLALWLGDVFADKDLSTLIIDPYSGQEDLAEGLFQRVEASRPEDRVGLAAEDDVDHRRRAFGDQHLVAFLPGHGAELREAARPAIAAREPVLVILGLAPGGVAEAMG